MIHDVANRIQGRLVSTRTSDGQTLTPVMVDPATVTLIVGLVSTVVKLVIKCIDERAETKAKQEAAEAYALSNPQIQPEEISEVSFRAEVATDIISGPTFFQRRMLRRAIRKKIGWIRNWFDGGEIYEAMLEEGQETSSTEMQELLDDIEVNPADMGTY